MIKLLTNTVLFTCLLLLPATTACAEQQPHILFIFSDDHTYRDIGAYGNEDVHTPNLDKLAAEGMRFERAFAASALCTPTRLAIASAQWPHGFEPYAKEYKNHFVGEMKSRGYHTVSVAKTFPGEFDEKIRDNKTSAKNAVKFIQDYQQDKPLFMVFGAEGTHLEWPQDEADRYDADTFTVQDNLLDTPETRARLKAYYSSVTCVDNQVGELLDAIEEKGWAENTIVIYSSDQGASMPFGKWCLYEDGIRVPMIVKYPGVTEPGSSTSAMISQIDFAPTMLEIASAGKPVQTEDVEGRSFLSVITGESDEHRDVIYASHRGDHGRGKNPNVDAMPTQHHNRNPAIAIRTADHKLIINTRPDVPFGIRLNGYCNANPDLTPDRQVTDYWRAWEKLEASDETAAKVVQHYLFRAPVELYDLNTDPWEMLNFATSDYMKPVREDLHTRLLDWQAKFQVKMPDYGPKKEEERRR